MSGPVVDVIIPVHTPARPIARAVASVLTGCRADVRVTVVCHDTSTASIATALGEWAADDRVRLLEHRDGIASPAGPINAGYRQVTAEFSALLDSDDEYERGAVDAWLEAQRRDDADAVIAPLRHADGRSARTPPTRPGRRSNLDGVRDRLAYRTRQHGLVRHSRFPGLAMTPGLRTGEDVIQGATLWYSDARISWAPNAPAYVIHSDDDDRTSASPKPAGESLAFLDALWEAEWSRHLTAAQWESFAIKVIRTHVMDVLATSLDGEDWATDAQAIAHALRRLTAVAPRAKAILSRREASIVDELLGSADHARLQRERAVLTDYRRPSNLLPASLRRLLHREAMPRFLAAVAVTR